MIEFKRAGDVMVFECDAFKIQVCGDSHSIKLSEAVLRSGTKPIGILENAFKVLDMMLEHKARQAHVMNFGVDVSQSEDAGESIDASNKKCRIRIEEIEAPLGHRFREFMKREGL